MCSLACASTSTSHVAATNSILTPFRPGAPTSRRRGAAQAAWTGLRWLGRQLGTRWPPYGHCDEPQLQSGKLAWQPGAQR